MLIRAYLEPSGNLSSDEQRKALGAFALKKGQRIADFFEESDTPSDSRPRLFELLKQKGIAIASGKEGSGASTPSHPQLFRLLDESKPGDAVLLCNLNLLESLPDSEWNRLRTLFKKRKTRLIALDVEASWKLMAQDSGTFPLIEAVNGAILDTLETASRQVVNEHRKRQLEGIARAKSEGKYKGRPIDRKKHADIQERLNSGQSWTDICNAMGVSRSTIARVAKTDYASSTQ